MPNKNSVKYTIGKEGAGTPGTPVATTAVLPIRDIGGLDRKIEKKTDPVIVGRGMVSGKYAVSADVKGPIPISPRACKGFGLSLLGVLGSEATPIGVIGVIRMRYTGASASCKIATDAGAKTINSKIGTLGAEANDAAFGTTGTLTLTNVAYDTVGELLALIDGYADYEAKLVTGLAASTITSVIAGTFQAKGKWVVLVLTGTSGAYSHRFSPNLTAGQERPTMSIQKDGFQDNYKYAGNVIRALSLSGALKAEIEGELDVLGMTEAIGQSASALTLEDAQPFLFGGGLTSVGGVDYDFVRQHSIKMETAHREDGYGQASLDRAFHQKDLFSASGDLTLRLDAVSVLERPKVESGTAVSLLLIYFAAESQIVANGVRGCLIIEVPYGEVDSFDPAENSGALDAKLGWSATAPNGANYYDGPLTVTLITADAAAY